MTLRSPGMLESSSLVSLVICHVIFSVDLKQLTPGPTCHVSAPFNSPFFFLEPVTFIMM